MKDQENVAVLLKICDSKIYQFIYLLQINNKKERKNKLYMFTNYFISNI